MIKNKEKLKPFLVLPKKGSEMADLVYTKKHPNHFLYGLGYIVSDNCKNYFSDIAFTKLNLLHWLFFPLEKWLIRETKTGFKIDQALLLYPRILNCDVIIAVGDSAALPIAFLKWLGVIKKPVIYITIGISGKMKKLATNTKIVSFYSQILSRIEKIICFSTIEKR
ncbi:hypothetical protein ACFLZ1_04370, partial [Patescibacteria group bacterium]